MSHVFVFGSNLAGKHGKGAALYARNNYGAVQGECVGRTGQAYAIPTKCSKLNTLHLDHIEPYVWDFVMYANAHPDLTFLLTRVGCGLAGYTDEQMLSIWPDALPMNVRVSSKWNERYPDNPKWTNE